MIISDYMAQEVRKRLFYPWHGTHILYETAVIGLDASWSARCHDSLKDQALEMLRTWIPQCTMLLDAIGERWDEAAKCAEMLRPLLHEVVSFFNSVDQPLITETLITEDIRKLLFPERWPTSRISMLEEHNDELPDETMFFDHTLSDDPDALQWAPEWDLMSADPV